MKLVKSPLNYTGGKFKLLPQILKHFPNEIGTFVDLFAGGGNVGANVKADKVIFNDTLVEVIGLLHTLSVAPPDYHLDYIDEIIERYSLDRENKEGYLKLREDYNKGISNSSYDFYTLICHSFSNQIRFNKKGEFNLPFGKRTFNEKLRENFSEFVERLYSINGYFYNMSFDNLLVNLFLILEEKDLVYCDPPYLITTATYNENGGWSEKEEKMLLSHLDVLDDFGIKFALSNVLDHKGRENTILKEWSKNFNVHVLDYDYNNASYQSKDTDKITVEVLITNY